MVSNLEAVLPALKQSSTICLKEQQARFSDVIDDLRDMQGRFEDQMELFGIFMETGTQKEISPQNVADTVTTLRTQLIHWGLLRRDISILTFQSCFVLRRCMNQNSIQLL